MLGEVYVNGQKTSINSIEKWWIILIEMSCQCQHQIPHGWLQKHINILQNLAFKRSTCTKCMHCYKDGNLSWYYNFNVWAWGSHRNKCRNGKPTNWRVLILVFFKLSFKRHSNGILCYILIPICYFITFFFAVIFI